MENKVTIHKAGQTVQAMKLDYYADIDSLDSDLSEWTSVESREIFEGLSRKWGSWINCWKSNLQQTMIARAANPATWVVLVNPKPFFQSNEPASKGDWTTIAADGIMTHE